MFIQVRPEHPQSQHVEKDVENIAVKKHVGDELPDREAMNHIGGNQTQPGNGKTAHRLQHERDAADDDQCLDCRCDPTRTE